MINKKRRRIVWKFTISVISLFFLSGCFGKSSSEKYEEDLNNGLEKYYRGEKMTEREYNAVKDYHKWQDDQKKEKTYDNWDE